MAGGVGGAGAGALMSMPSIPDVAGATNASSAMILNALGAGGAGLDDILQREKDRALNKQRLEMDKLKTSADISKIGTEVEKLFSDMTTNEFQQALMASGKEVNLQQARKIQTEVKKAIVEINKIDAEIAKIKSDTSNARQELRLKKLEETKKKVFDRVYDDAGNLISRAVDKIKGNRKNLKDVIDDLKKNSIYTKTGNAIDKAKKWLGW